MKVGFLIYAMVIGGYIAGYAQSSRLDSLLAAEKTYVQRDAVRLTLLVDLAGELRARDPETGLNFCNEAIDIAQKTGDNVNLAMAFNYKAQSYFMMQNFEEAIENCEIYLKLCNSNIDSLGIARAHHNLGSIYMETFELNKAINEYEQAIPLYQKLGTRHFLAGSYNNLGIVYTLMGNYSQALKYQFLSLDIYQELGNLSRIAKSYNDIGNIHSYMRDEEKAREYYFKCVAIYKEQGDLKGLADINENIALTYHNDKDKTKAIDYHLAALEYNEKSGNWGKQEFTWTNVAHFLNHLCDADYQILVQNGNAVKIGGNTQNQHTLALELSTKACDFLSDRKNSFHYAFAMNIRGESFRFLGQYDSALYCSKVSLGVADNIQSQDKKCEALSEIHSSYEALGKYDSAYAYFKQYITIRDSIHDKDKREEIARKDMQYQFELKEKDLRCQNEMSEIAAEQARAHLQQQLLVTKTREQELQIKSSALALSNKEKDLVHLAYLKKMAELNVVKLEKKDKEKQLNLSQKENSLQTLQLKNRGLQRNILFIGILLSLISLFFIVRNYSNQRKSNVKLLALNSDLSATLLDLKQTQEQLIFTEKQKETEAIRRRISQDIHDDISSGLTRIAWLSEMVKAKSLNDDNKDLSPTLGKIVDSSRETIERLGEIIWAINPDKDNLEGFFAYLRTYIMNYLEGTPFTARLHFPEEKLDVRFNPDLKRTLFLVVKEAIHNVVRHSGGETLEVSFVCQNHNYLITIRDDGRGFKKHQVNERSNGLKNMQHRMEGVGGTFQLETVEGKGTQIVLSGMIYS